MTQSVSSIVAKALAELPSHRRGVFLRELLAMAAAGLKIIEGERPAAEAMYRLADAIVEGEHTP